MGAQSNRRDRPLPRRRAQAGGRRRPRRACSAPHLNVAVFARGLLKQVLTRDLLPRRAGANAADPVLELVPAEDRALLVAVADGEALRFDIHLQGERETPFFAF